jgi:hypothetical protein
MNTHTVKIIAQSEVSIDEFGLSDGWTSSPTVNRTPSRPRSMLATPEMYPTPASIFTIDLPPSYEEEREEVEMHEITLEMDERPQPLVMFRDEGHLPRSQQQRPRVNDGRSLSSSLDFTIKEPRVSLTSDNKWKVLLMLVALAAIIYAITRMVALRR